LLHAAVRFNNEKEAGKLLEEDVLRSNEPLAVNIYLLVNFPPFHLLYFHLIIGKEDVGDVI
jgi:hypothetical protein